MLDMAGKDIKRRRSKASSLCLAMLAILIMAMMPGQSFAKKMQKKRGTKPSTSLSPDFAFPKTVEKNAGIQLDEALKKQDGEGALRAAIQLNVASGLISADSYGESLSRYDTLARVLPSPWSNLALLLEARLYCDIYSSKPWIFNNRQLPLTPRPENVLEWSTLMFSAVVTDLCGKALQNGQVLAMMPISSISGVLDNSAEAQKRGFSVFDFISLQSVNMIGGFESENEDALLPLRAVSLNGQTLRTGANGSVDKYLTVNSVIEKAIEESVAEGNLFKESYWAEMKFQRLPATEKKDYIQQCIDRFSDTPYCAQFICDYCSMLPGDNDGRRNQMRLLDDYIERYPNAEGINAVKNRAAELRRQNVNVAFESQMLPDRENRVVVSGENLYNFHILAVALPEKSDQDSYRYSDLSSGRVAVSVPVNERGTTPDAYNATITFPALKPGTYAIVPSRTAGLDGVLVSERRGYLSVVNVSGISAYSVGTEGKKNFFYVVSGVNQKPVENAKVTFYTYKGGAKVKYNSYVTDAAGRFEFDPGRYEYVVKTAEGVLTGSVYGGGVREWEEEREYKGALFTDLSLYRPGAKVGFAGIVYTKEDKTLASAPEKEVAVVLRDANWIPVDTLQMKSDKYGRFNGEFTLPETGLAGTWGMIMNDGDRQICSTQFQVAEYKAPSFLAEINGGSESYKVGDKLTFKGYAKTYSGMPVAGAKVAYTVSWMPGWWRRYGEKASFGGETVTNADGTFEIELETSALKGTAYERGLFQISGEVTDSAGETQAFPGLRFSLGTAYSINASLPSAICKEKSSEVYKVTVNDIAGRPIKKKVYYEISAAEGKVVTKGEFDSSAFSPDLKSLASGRYAFRFSLSPDMKETDDNPVRTDSVILWSKADKRPPIATCLWVPEKRYVAPNGAKTVNVSVGSSLKDGYVLAIVSDSKRYISADWHKISDGIVSLPVETPADDERIFVEFIGESELEMKRERVEILPYVQTKKLEIKTETFRDRIEPGAEEKWTFRFNLSDEALPAIPVMAVMTDKSLNAIAPFSWSFNPYGALSWYSPVGINQQYRYGGSNNYMSTYKYLRDSAGFALPGFNTYGYSLYFGGRYFGGGYMLNMQTSSRKMSRSMKMVEEESADDGAVVMYDEVAMAGSAEAPMAVAESAVVNEMKAEAVEEEPEEIEMRESDFPLAFFKPCLVTDEEGVATVEFTAPQFVGTWQLQLLGYTPDMRGATISLDAVSAKSVMANLNAPRFVRTGDKVNLVATLFNNIEKPLPIEGKLIILDAVGGKEIASRKFEPVEVSASGSRIVEMQFVVPADVEALTLRVIAKSANHTDGEQTIVPVLPATSVVRESKTFYMGPSASEMTVKLPKYDKDASVTMTYCGNPTWECLTALPALVASDSQSILVQADALFGNAVASGLLGKYPQLMDGLRALSAPENAADSALYSPLQKNAELKDILLNNTPWVNAAASETLRMQSLMKYADKEASDKAISEAVKMLADRQNRDGGWGWCPDMPSSGYMTSRVLGVLSDLRNLGYMPEKAEKPARKAFAYMDKSLAEDWIRTGRKSYSLSELVHYLYAKSAFHEVGNSGSFGALEKVAMADLEKEWRDLSLYDKATAAILLERKGKARASRLILESLRQFASESAEKGMWFDNLSGVWNSNGPLLTTARVLEAFATIEPQNPAIDKLRQWIVLSKQTQDWEGSRNATEAICALLSSGSDWAVPAEAPVVTLGGKKLELPRTAILTGAFTLNVDAREASGAVLSVVKSNETPAWGGVVARYVAPIKDTKAVSMAELSVKKALNVLSADAGGMNVTSGQLKVGDKVRVTITLICDRDLDYVAVVDNRAACLEPAEQLSAYTASDGVWYYREVRDTKTTLFIPFLSKGTHVISYDCYVDRAGDYSLGIVSAQSQYAPLITASSAGEIIEIK